MNTILLLKELSEEEISGNDFYVIEKFPYPQFVTDENGAIKTFDNYDDAFNEVSDCQQGYVVSFQFERL
jgi:hypothetical protein